MPKTIAIIGGGAAGFFCAINAAQKNPADQVFLFEKSSKVLAKVLVSGGGRCNVTHACFDEQLLVKNYPRGEKQLKSVFSRFAVTDTIQWYKNRGVELHEEPDGRMFPTSNKSESIANCLLQEAQKANIQLNINSEIKSIEKKEGKFKLHLNDNSIFSADAVVVTIGGHPKKEKYFFLENLGHKIKDPIPSLFTINLPQNPITSLMGIVANPVKIKITGTNYLSVGPLLITHWGFSGPAVLKLSAFAAENFHQKEYKSSITINWLNLSEEEIRTQLLNFIQVKGNALPYSNPLFSLSKRLWEYILHKAEIPDNKPWAEISKKQLNKLILHLFNDEFFMEGKTTFKEEFVTCGGVPLNEVDLRTMQSKVCKNLYFAGEVLDIDGITGGFNFQAAWSTAWIAAQNL